MKLLASLALAFLGTLSAFYVRDRMHSPHVAAPRGPATAAQAPAPTTVARTSMHAPSPDVGSMRAHGGGGNFAVIDFVQLGTGEPRKFNIKIERVLPNGAAVASGCFYDIDPSLNTTPEALPAGERKWTQAGRIAVFGLVNAIDGQEWKGWLERDATAAYTTFFSGDHTVPSYRVITAPADKAYAAKPGAWMNLHGRTALDR